MARPKRSNIARLDILIERKSKRDAFLLASKQRISVGRLFELLVKAEKKRDGQLALQNFKELVE